VELVLCSNYSIVEAGLPGEMGVALGPDAFCAFAFELTNDGTKVCLAHLADASFVETPRWGVSWGFMRLGVFFGFMCWGVSVGIDDSILWVMTKMACMCFGMMIHSSNFTFGRMVPVFFRSSVTIAPLCVSVTFSFLTSPMKCKRFFLQIVT